MRRALLIAFLAFGCSGSESATPPPAFETPATSERCRTIYNEITTALEGAGGSCETDTDCSLIGGQMVTQTCACARFVGECGGVAIPKNAPGREQVLAKMQEFMGAGCANGSSCRCAAATFRCSAEKRCVATPQTCPAGAPEDPPEGW